MRRPVTILIIALAGVLLLVTPAQATAPESADSADSCVAFTTAEQSSGLAFDLRNGCDRGLACSLSWTVSCQNASGNTTSTAKHGASFVVAADTTHRALGSAATCKDGWRIDDITWDCTPARGK